MGRMVWLAALVNMGCVSCCFDVPTCVDDTCTFAIDPAVPAVYVEAAIEASTVWREATRGRSDFQPVIKKSGGGFRMIVRECQGEDTVLCVSNRTISVDQTHDVGDRLLAVMVHEMGHFLLLPHTERGTMAETVQRLGDGTVDEETIQDYCDRYGTDKLEDVCRTE